MKEIELDILNQSYWEHFKVAKELSHLYPPEHIKRVEISTEIHIILTKIENLKK